MNDPKPAMPDPDNSLHIGSGVFLETRELPDRTIKVTIIDPNDPFGFTPAPCRAKF
jgi:hypothetical protein